MTLRSGTFGVLALLAMSTSPVAAAADVSSLPEPSPGVAEPERWLLGAGLGMSLVLSDVVEGTYDAVEISSFAFTDLVLEPMVLVAPSVSLGVRGSWGFELGSRAQESTDGERIEKGRHVWQVAPSARYQPRVGRGWYLTGNVGIAGITDSFGEQSATQMAPLLSAALGIDLHVAAPVSIGAELRGAYAIFSDEGERILLLRPDQATYRYGPTGWLGVSLLGRFLL